MGTGSGDAIGPRASLARRVALLAALLVGAALALVIPGGSTAQMDTGTAPGPAPSTGEVPNCPAGTQDFDEFRGKCIGPDPEFCPEPGFREGEQCVSFFDEETEECPEGYSTNPDEFSEFPCVGPAPSAECEEGFEFNADTDQCESGTTGMTTCPAGSVYFDEGSGTCIAPRDECPEPSSFDDEERHCFYDASEPSECTEGFVFVPANGHSSRCVADPECPEGFTLRTKTTCEAPPIAASSSGGANDPTTTEPTTDGGGPTGDDSATVRGRLIVGGGTARAAQASGLSGFVFYVDYNRDGGIDVEDPRTVSDAAGNWIIGGIRPGTHTLRMIPRSGFTCLDPPDCARRLDFAPRALLDVQYRAAPVAPPVRGESVQVGELNGEVLIKLPPGTSASVARRIAGAAQAEQGFIPIERVVNIPVRSIIETRRGTALITVAQGRRSSRRRNVVANGGRFEVLQSATGSATTELKLNGGGFRTRCTPRAGKATAAGSRRSVRRVRTRTRGRRGSFRTRGRYSTATVRGTDWTTIDRCDGTMTSVRRGVVRIRDLTVDRVVTLRRGARYLAGPGRRRR